MKHKVIHILDSKNIHLNPSIIESTYKHQEDRHTHCFYISLIGSIHTKREQKVYNNLKKDINNIFYFTSLLEYIKLFYKNDSTIILHGFISPFKKNFFVLNIIYFFFRKKLRQVNLVSWGGIKPISKLTLLNNQQHKILRSLNSVLALSHEDKTGFEQIKCKNVVLIKYLMINSNVKSIEAENKKFIVMVSHSGWPENQHLKSFELLKDKLSGDYEVICPLAYGNPGYIHEVIAKGRELFGDRFVYFTDLMKLNEYEDLLRSVTVFITSAEGQTGLFNISSCLANGAKVFCQGNLYNTLNEYGFKVFHTSDVERKHRENWWEISLKEKQVNKTVYYEVYKDIPSLIKKWNKIYDTFT